MNLVRNYCLIHRVELEYEHHNGRLWCDTCKEYIDDPLRMYLKLDPSEVLIYDRMSKRDIIEQECNLDEYVNLRRLQ